MSEISTPILGETTTEFLIPKLKEFAKTAKLIKTHYPSTWAALVRQFKLDYNETKLSDELFDRKLEIMLLQDEESRKV